MISNIRLDQRSSIIHKQKKEYTWIYLMPTRIQQFSEAGIQEQLSGRIVCTEGGSIAFSWMKVEAKM